MGCTFRGGRQGGEVNVWAYMKEFLKYFSKTDPCAREFRQRSIVAPYMGMCTLNTRPLQELKFAIFTPPGDTFRGVPARRDASFGTPPHLHPGDAIEMSLSTRAFQRW